MSHDPIFDGDLQTLAEHLPFDVWMRDREHRLVYANPVARERWGIAKGSLPEDGTAVNSQTLEVWKRNNARALAGEVVRAEERFVVGGRERVFLNIIAPIIVDGAVRGTIGMNADLTDLHDANARADRLDNVMRTLFLCAPFAIGVREIRGEDLVHIDDNPRSAALFGTTPDTLRDRTDLEIGVSQEKVDRAIARFRQSKSTSAPVDFEAVYQFPDGQHTVVGKVVPLPAEPHEPSERFAFFAEDITRMRQLEAGMQRADRLATLGTIAAGIGHEIKNPASYVALHLGMAIDRLAHGPLDELMRTELLDQLRIANDGLDRIVGLVRDMMHVASPSGMTLGPVDLRQVVDTVLQLAASDVRGHARLVRIDGDVPPARGNAMRLAQVILNLVLNALRAFGTARGTLWITTERGREERVALTIADDGPGLPREVRAHLFEPFVSAGTSPESNGLGLFVSHQIVTAMGGTLEATDRPEGGTSFRIELPTHPGKEAEPSGP